MEKIDDFERLIRMYAKAFCEGDAEAGTSIGVKKSWDTRKGGGGQYARGGALPQNLLQRQRDDKSIKKAKKDDKQHDKDVKAYRKAYKKDSVQKHGGQFFVMPKI